MSDLAPLSPREPSLPEEAPSQAPKIGDRLRQARERRGVTITEASATLKIRAPILEAFEREDHSQLPPRVYALGQLRTYAAYLGLDPATVAAGWQGEAVYEGAPTPVRSQPTTSAVERFVSLRPSIIRSTRGLLALGGLGIAVLLISSVMVLQL